MPASLRAALAGGLLCLGSPAMADCDYAQKSPRPAWVAGASTLEGFYTGVGQAEQGKLDITQQIDLAKQAALRDLTNSIRVNVKTEFSISESLGDGGAQQSATSSTQTSSTLQLSDVRTDEMWTDASTCALWLRVKVARSLIEKLLAREEQLNLVRRLRELLDRAGDESLPVTQREQALESAAPMAGQIDYAVAADGSTLDYFLGQIGRLRDRLRGARSSFEDTSALLARARGLLQKARLEKTLSSQARYAGEARTLLTQVSTQSAFGVAPDYWPESALAELADYEQFAGNPCEAQRLLRDLSARASSADWKTRAATRLATTTCTAPQREVSAWRSLIFGREVELYCVYKAGSQVESWARACADLTALVSSHGALKVESGSGNAAQALKLAEECSVGCARPGLSIFMRADGSLGHRDNPQNPLGKDHQFRGQISTFVLKDGALEFTDSYNGVGGWNPVSADMAMDVLAIQAGRRLREKATAYYSAKE